MKIDFNSIQVEDFKGMYGGQGTIRASMHSDKRNKFLRGSLDVGASMGSHVHNDSCEVVFIQSGSVRFACDGAVEHLAAGMCHYCPKGSRHTMVNEGDVPAEFLAIVIEQ